MASLGTHPSKPRPTHANLNRGGMALSVLNASGKLPSHLLKVSTPHEGDRPGWVGPWEFEWGLGRIPPP